MCARFDEYTRAGKRPTKLQINCDLLRQAQQRESPLLIVPQFYIASRTLGHCDFEVILRKMKPATFELYGAVFETRTKEVGHRDTARWPPGDSSIIPCRLALGARFYESFYESRESTFKDSVPTQHDFKLCPCVISSALSIGNDPDWHHAVPNFIFGLFFLIRIFGRGNAREM